MASDYSQGNKITEQASHYANLDKMSTLELLQGMNEEDKSVPIAVEKAIPQIESFVDALVERMRKGGRLFYIGAGTSGRLGILDASEIPPTYGAPYNLVIGLIAGGDTAIRKAVENAEDDPDAGWADLQKFNIGGYDSLVGVAASGSTPYVVGACAKAREQGVKVRLSVYEGMFHVFQMAYLNIPESKKAWAEAGKFIDVLRTDSRL